MSESDVCEPGNPSTAASFPLSVPHSPLDHCESMESCVGMLPVTGLVCAASGEHAVKCGTHIERPERVFAIMKCLESEGLVARCRQIECRDASLEELEAVHTEAHIQLVQDVVETVFIEDESMYLTPSSFACACQAVGGTVELVHRVLTGELTNGIAVVRPPGHHVDVDAFAGGFGVFNNVAVAATAARMQFGVERVLIADWDVHHGNGTQHIFESDPSILYFSIHRYDNGNFFPCSKDAAPEVVGHGVGRGFNINVAWNIAWKDADGMGDDEYLAAWQSVLLPVAQEFQPQLILVSAGFDAAVGDVGGCCVTPAGFAQMTRMLQNICPKVVLALEGGYKLCPISECVCACARMLVGDDLPMLGEVRPKKEARISIERTLRAHRPFWASLRNVDIMSVAKVPVQGHMLSSSTPARLTTTRELADAQIEPLDQPPKKPVRRNKKPKERAITGVNIATRNAANGNWKNDVKKLSRKEIEIQAALEKIETIKCSFQKCPKLPAKDRIILESEDEFKWQLEEINLELQELRSLSKDDVLRMYGGCK